MDEKHDNEIEVLTPIPRPYEGKPAHNAHPPETKLRAIGLIAKKGPSEAAKELGISRHTIEDWAAEYREEIALIRSAEFTDEIDNKIRDILKQIQPEKIEKANFRDLLVGLGIAIDKRQQLLGPQKKEQPRQRLRIVWKGESSGAIEVEQEQ